MKQDLKSYQQHDSEFNTPLNSQEKTKAIVEDYDKINQFRQLGFDFAVRMSNPLPKTHVDIGSGNGWLVRKTSPLFEKVIGIEPSAKGVSLACEITKGCNNVNFINKDMVEGLVYLQPKDPIFLTTATVLSHIEDFYVSEFLKLVNALPTDSTLCFDERYDKNIHWKMWHIRSKEWWEERLPNWQLFFFNLENNSYPSTLFGICLGKENTLRTHKMSLLKKLSWKLSKSYYLLNRITKKLLKSVKS